MEQTERSVDRVIERQLRKNEEELSYALIEPLSPNWLFSTNGVYFFCGKMGSGKTYTIMKHILMTERLFESPYYDTIIFTSTSGSLDKTVSAMKDEVRTPITYVKDDQLMTYLQSHIENKMRFYSLIRFIKSEGQVIDEMMQQTLQRLNLYRMKGRERVYDWRRIAQLTVKVMEETKLRRYPSYTLLVMDDFAGHPLLAKVDSPLARMLTKTRHYNITALLAVQTWRFVNLNFKRLCTDIVVWKGFSEEDFKNMITQTPNDQNWRSLWSSYSSMESNHSKMTLHIASSTVTFDQ